MRVDAPETGRPERLGSLPLLGLLVVLAAVGYGDTLGDFFLSDDFALIRVAYGATNFVEAAGLGAHGGAAFLRPVTKLVWWANHQIGGTEPIGYHLVNVLFHVVNAWLVACIVFALSRHRFAAWVCSAAFVVYPIHPEAVTWVSGRVDVITATGYFTATLFWIRFVSGPGRVAHLFATAIGFAIALLSKEMAVTFPVTAAVIAVAVRGDAARHRRLVGLAVLAMVLVAYLGGRIALLGGLGGYQGAGGESLHLRADPGQAIQFMKQAGRQAVAPAVWARHPGTFDPLRLIPVIAIALAALTTFAAGDVRRLLRQALLGGALFFISLGPLLGWVELAPDGQCSRFLYLPSAFACTMLGAAFLARPGSTPRRYALSAFAVVWIGLYAIGLRDANRPWREAARMTRTIVDRAIERTQSRPEVNVLAVTDLPDNHEGAYVFRNCIEQAVFLSHPAQMLTFRVPRSEWEKARDEARAVGDRGTLFLRWDAASGAWRED